MDAGKHQVRRRTADIDADGRQFDVIALPEKVRQHTFFGLGVIVEMSPFIAMAVDGRAGMEQWVETDEMRRHFSLLLAIEASGGSSQHDVIDSGRTTVSNQDR